MDIDTGFASTSQMSVSDEQDFYTGGLSVTQMLLMMTDEDGDKQVSEKDSKEFSQKLSLNSLEASSSSNAQSAMGLPGPADELP